MALPKSPGDWINHWICECGETYDRFNSGVTFKDGRDMAKIHNGNDSDWWPSRGPILWAMRVHKMNLWFESHLECFRFERLPF